VLVIHLVNLPEVTRPLTSKSGVEKDYKKGERAMDEQGKSNVKNTSKWVVMG
jgi:hypothetical protein